MCFQFAIINLNNFKTHFGLTISVESKIVIWLSVFEHAEAHDFSQMKI